MKYVPPINGDTANANRSYVNANPGAGVEGSIPPAAAFEHTQREIINAITAFGLTPNGEDLNQLATAMLGLSSLPIGAEIMWSNSVIPANFLEQNGATFSGATYPGLAAHLGSTTLPDLRGEFVRGWDHGRGIDSGRTLGSYQADELKAHVHNQTYESGHQTGGSRVVARGNLDPAPGSEGTFSTGGTETRPRNRSRIFLIKAL